MTDIKCDHVWKKWDEDGIEYCERCNYEKPYIEYLQGLSATKEVCSDCNGTGMNPFKFPDARCPCTYKNELPF